MFYDNNCAPSWWWRVQWNGWCPWEKVLCSWQYISKCIQICVEGWGEDWETPWLCCCKTLSCQSVGYEKDWTNQQKNSRLTGVYCIYSHQGMVFHPVLVIPALLHHLWYLIHRSSTSLCRNIMLSMSFSYPGLQSNLPTKASKSCTLKGYIRTLTLFSFLTPNFTSGWLHKGESGKQCTVHSDCHSRIPLPSLGGYTLLHFVHTVYVIVLG